MNGKNDVKPQHLTPKDFLGITGNLIFPDNDKKKGGPKVVVATGISGTGKDEHFSEWQKYCFGYGKKVLIFPIGDMMLQLAAETGHPLNKENIFNADPDILMFLRSGVLLYILTLLKCGILDDYDAVVLNLHSVFYWENCLKESYDRFLNNFNIDMYVTFIDDFRQIWKRLAPRKQWEGINLTDHEILIWQNTEVIVTKSLATKDSKPFFVIPTDLEGVDTFFKLVFHPEMPRFYTAMPISHFREPEERVKIDNFIRRLRKHGAVFNPLSCEIVAAVNIRRKSALRNKSVHQHITLRDVNWFVPEVDTIVVLWPEAKPPKELFGALKSKKSIRELVIKYWPKVVPSPGADHETHEAFIKTKNVWVVYLGDEASPFITSYNTGIFGSIKAFFRFLSRRCPPLIPPKKKQLKKMDKKSRSD